MSLRTGDSRLNFVSHELGVIVVRVLSTVAYIPFSGVTAWNMRLAGHILQNPGLGIDYSVLEFVNMSRYPQFDVLTASAELNASVRSCWKFSRVGRLNANRWSESLEFFLENHLLPAGRSADFQLPFDVILADSGAIQPYIYAFELQRRTGRRPAIISVIHNDAAMHYEMAGELLIPGSDVVLGVSQHICNLFQKQFPDRPAPVYLSYPVPVSRQPPEVRVQPGDPLQLCWCGRVELNQKRVLDLVTLAHILEQRHVDFKMTFIGDGPDMPALKSAVGKLSPGLQHRVAVMGRVPFEQIPEILSQQHVLLSASAFEGTSVSMLEAMGLGLIPVVTDIASGVRDVIQHGVNGFISPIGDMNSMADSLVMLANNREMISNMAVKSWKAVESTFGERVACARWSDQLIHAAQVPRPAIRVQPLPQFLNRLDRPWMPDALTNSIRALLRRFR